MDQSELCCLEPRKPAPLSDPVRAAALGLLQTLEQVLAVFKAFPVKAFPVPVSRAPRTTPCQSGSKGLPARIGDTRVSKNFCFDSDGASLINGLAARTALLVPAALTALPSLLTPCASDPPVQHTPAGSASAEHQPC